ncbi:MAG: hypothetical protein V4485_03700 [Pseudomonadota bacterium]
MDAQGEVTVILYLIGKPGTGKYSIAKELAKTGYTICDNQLINNPIFALLNYDGKSNLYIPEFAWEAIGEIRKKIFDFLVKKTEGSYILTNVLYEDEGDKELFHAVEDMALQRGSTFIPVKLLISEEENIKRIQNIDRSLRYKSIDIEDAKDKRSLLAISHPSLLELDVSELSAESAANRIIAWSGALRK